MEWRIDTSMIGEVKVADLRKTLEASRDHWLKTQAEAAAAHVAYVAVGNVGKPGQPTPDMVAVGITAQAAAEAHKKKSASLAQAMAAGIDAACSLAELQGGIVTATIVGHDDERHASGCGKRISVAVDQTWE